MRFLSALRVWLVVLCSCLALAFALHIQTLSVLRSFPHDSAAFTEGLCFAPSTAASAAISDRNPLVLESTGIWRASTLRLTDLHTGRVLRELRLTTDEFGEGTAVVGADGEPSVLQLTYQNGTAYQYPLSALLGPPDAFDVSAAASRVASYTYPKFVREGWGLAAWPGSASLFMSDGTNTVHELHAANFSHVRSHTIVLDNAPGQADAARPAASPLSFNELELLSPELLLANLYPTRCLALVNLTSARLLSVVQADGEGEPLYRSPFPALEVLNGIAYRPGSAGSSHGVLLVTGKLWPRLYQVTIVERSGRGGDARAELSDDELFREACPAPEWTAAEEEHAKLVVAALQRNQIARGLALTVDSCCS